MVSTKGWNRIDAGWKAEPTGYLPSQLLGHFEERVQFCDAVQEQGRDSRRYEASNR